jgi:plasmid stabilization system protein ParE
VVKLTWTVRARADLMAIYAYIATDNKLVALRVASRLVAATERLAAFPESGRPVPEHGDHGVREAHQLAGTTAAYPIATGANEAFRP